MEPLGMPPAPRREPRRPLPRPHAVRGARSAALAVAAIAALALPACRSDTPIVRNVPLVRDVFPEPPFPQGWRVADLTLALDSTAPHIAHPQQFPFERMDLAPATKGSARTGGFTAMEHTGTHLAAPRTRNDAGATVERFGGDDLLLPLAVLDIPSDASSEAVMSVDMIKADERSYGDIPDGAVVVLRTRSGAADAVHPGWAGPAVRWLVKERRTRVVGTDAPAIDSSAAERAPAQGVAGSVGIWTLASLRHLDAVPHRGAYVVIGVLPIVSAAAAPARVVALVPPDAPPPPEPSKEPARVPAPSPASPPATVPSVPPGPTGPTRP